MVPPTAAAFGEFSRKLSRPDRKAGKAVAVAALDAPKRRTLRDQEVGWLIHYQSLDCCCCCRLTYTHTKSPPQREEDDEYMQDLRREWTDIPDEWRYDVIPEIMDGKNVADFVDPDIMAKLEALEAEEERREAAGEYESDEEDADVKKVRATAAVCVAMGVFFPPLFV